MKEIIVKVMARIINFYNLQQMNSLKKRMKYCGENVSIDHNTTIVVPGQLKIGKNTSIACYTTIYAAFGVHIGENCLISSCVGISSLNHNPNSPNRYLDRQNDEDYSKPVKIGNNVWIGMNVTILPGSDIGNNCVIGAGSVVTGNIPSNQIWFGNPAKYYKNV